MARLSAIGLAGLAVLLLRSAAGDDSPETFFELKVRPVLATNCLPCHGGKKTSSGLKVDSREALLARRRPRAGDRAGRARKEPADPGDSSGRRRPEDAAGPAACRRSRPGRLPSGLPQGAAWPKADASEAGGARAAGAHWAFERVKVAEPPPDPSGWSSGPIDRFVAARRRAAGLSPVRRADRRTLDPPRDVRPDRSAAHAGGDRRVPRRSIARRVRPGRRSAAGLAALRRALGAALDGRRPLRRHGRRQRRLPDPGSGPLPRLHHRLVQRRQAVRPVRPRAAGRRHPGATGRRRSATPSRSSPPASWPSRGGTRRRRSSSGI